MISTGASRRKAKRFLLPGMLVLAACTPALPASAEHCIPPNTKPYDGPIFDAMAQTGQWLDGEAALAAARSAGVARMALFARVHKKEDGRSLVDGMASAHSDFVVVGAPKLFDMRGDLDGLYVRDVLAGVTAKHYAFVGEILYTHGDKAGGETTQSGERYIDPTRPNTARLVEGLAGKHIPLMAHWEVYQWGRDWPKFDRLYGAYPDQVFVWPHVGFASAQQATTVLAAHANVWATLSKKERDSENLEDEDKAERIGSSVTDRCVNLTPEWREVMVRFSDRLMFATDAHVERRWSKYAQIVARWRLILAQLPPDVAAAIAYGNAARLYGR